MGGKVFAQPVRGPGFHPDSSWNFTNTSVYLHVYMFPKPNTVLLLEKTIVCFFAILEIDHGQASELPLNTIPKPEGKNSSYSESCISRQFSLCFTNILESVSKPEEYALTQ